MGFGQLFEANQTTFDYLLKLRSPLSIAVLEEDELTGDRKLLGEKQVEWRFVLVHRSLSMNHEIAHSDLAKGPLGVLKINYQLVTRGGHKVKLSEEALDGQLEAETKAVAIKAKTFFDYSQLWYSEFKQLKPEFAKRAVKIYVEHNTAVAFDSGKFDSAPLKPIFTYITRLKLRGIDSPEHAARFVSLIPFSKPDTATNPLGTWRNLHSFVAEGRGQVQDHAALLCSLFLGFGLDAYICLGSCTDGAHCWVMTRIIENNGPTSQKVLIHYWESLTGAKYSQNDPKVNYLYRRVGCVFNEKKYFANMQESDTVE
jgi:centrosomal protein CEP76